MSKNDIAQILIHTKDLAALFDKELCAYVTGEVGECELAVDIADQYKKEIKHNQWWTENIIYTKDSDGYMQPMYLSSTPGWFNNGCGGLYKDNAAMDKKAHDDAIAFAKNFIAKQVREAETRLKQNSFDAEWTKSYCYDVIDNATSEVRRVAKKAVKDPAYMTIGISVRDVPPKEVLLELVKRVKNFTDSCGTIMNVENLRKIIFTSVDVIDTNGRILERIRTEDRQ
jgi:hypothetical protein